MSVHDILIINSGNLHSLRGTEDALYLKLSIQYALISDVADVWEVIFRCDSTRNRDNAYGELETLLRKLLSRYLGNQGNAADFLHIALCYQLLDFLCAHFLVRDSGAVLGGNDNRSQARVRRIRAFIQNNYADAISLKDMSEKFYLSSGYFSRFFHQNFGMGFSDYLKKVRLHHAMDELLYSALPITRIVYDCGFANVTVFNKAFKEEYGETPSAVRKRAAPTDQRVREALSEDVQASLRDILWSEDATELAGKAKRKEDKVVALSSGHASLLTPIWNFAVNAGRAGDSLDSRLREHILQFRKNMGFTYVRFWSPFSQDMLINPEHSHYNFTRLDGAVDGLRLYL